MSYNNIKVNSISSSSANVTINLENLSNTSFSSLANDHILKYDGTNWINSALSSSAKEYIFIGEGASQPYSGSGHTSIAASNHVISVYDSSPINTISNASFSYKDSDSSTNWIISITIIIYII